MRPLPAILSTSEIVLRSASLTCAGIALRRSPRGCRAARGGAGCAAAGCVRGGRRSGDALSERNRDWPLEVILRSMGCGTSHHASPTSQMAAVAARPLQTPDYSMETQRLDVWLDITCLFRTRSGGAKGLQNGARFGERPAREAQPGGPGRGPGRDVPAVRPQAVPGRTGGWRRSTSRRPRPARFTRTARRRRALRRSRCAGMERLDASVERDAPGGTPDKRERRRIRKLKEGSSADRSSENSVQRRSTALTCSAPATALLV